MKRESKQVAYSYEHGDNSLPHIADLVSDIPDPEKSRILEYLRTNCIIVCPGIVRDEICPERTIGHGDIFSDGTYRWNDVFINYVEKYNIPVPKEFREHILKNYSARKKRHMQLKIVNCVEIQNNPYQGFEYNIRVYKNGVIKYQNNIDCTDEAMMIIKPEDAEYIIDPITTELFCYDSDEHGAPVIDGHHWKIVFFRDLTVIDEKEGWEGEDSWRYGKFKRIIEFIERFIPHSLGSVYM